VKKLVKKTKGLIRGVPSAVLLSALIHAALLLGAGLVILTAAKKQPTKFVPPPPVERPKMNLTKPRVKLKNNVKSGSVQRLVSKAVQSMPDVALPPLEGTGQGMGTGLGGGFELVPDVSELGLYGAATSFSSGNDFVGTLYSFNYSRSLKYRAMDRTLFWPEIKKFLENDWNPLVFSYYYRSPQKLYTTHFMIPPTSSSLAQSAFKVDLEKFLDPPFWLVHYKGKISYKEGGKFRLWGAAIDVLEVRVKGKLVLSAGWGGEKASYEPDDWKVPKGDQLIYPLGALEASFGHWFTLEPGEVADMEVLLGEYGGGVSQFMLLVEDASQSSFYPRRKDGMMILPIFKTAELSNHLKDQIKYTLISEDADLDGGPVFNVY